MKLKSIPKKTNKAFKKLNSKAQLLVIILAVGVIGTLSLTLSGAAPNTASIEPEDTMLNGVTRSSNASASGGESIKFGNPSSNGTGLMLISTKSELSQIKSSVASGNKKAYWEYVQGRAATRVNTTYTPNWNADVTFNNYTFNPKRFVSTDYARETIDAQGSFMMNAAHNAYGCALEWAIAGDQACGTHTINILDQWSKNLTYIYCRPSGIDARENQVKLWSEWSVPMFTKSAEIMWDHPSFTPAMKTQFADWMWNTFLLKSASLQESDGEILGMSAVGWNGRMSAFQSRLFAGLTMKAAGHSEANNVIDDTITKLQQRLPEVLYYGKEPWHEVLGQGWPKQPYRHKNTTYSNWHTAAGIKSYWQLSSSASSPPAFFVGQVQETGRDVGHTQMGTGALAETLKAMRLNGYADLFSKNGLGDILLQLGERSAKTYNEALDTYWASPNSYPYPTSPSIEGLSCGWKPTGWDTIQANSFNKAGSCPSSAPASVNFKVAGTSADHGWELLRTELKRSGYSSTPQLDRIVGRLRGTGNRTANNAAGFSSVDLANHLGWEPLFAPDYQ